MTKNYSNTKYELCGYPPALFDNPNIMRQPNKATLGDELWKMLGEDLQFSTTLSSFPRNVRFVLDGGSFLQRLQAPWKRGTTFEAVIYTYVNFVNNHYPESVVVFNGYCSGPSTKD